jgi:hypothetical protein
MSDAHSKRCVDNYDLDLYSQKKELMALLLPRDGLAVDSNESLDALGTKEEFR